MGTRGRPREYEDTEWTSGYTVRFPKQLEEELGDDLKEVVKSLGYTTFTAYVNDLVCNDLGKPHLTRKKVVDIKNNGSVQRKTTPHKKAPARRAKKTAADTSQLRLDQEVA